MPKRNSQKFPYTLMTTTSTRGIAIALTCANYVQSFVHQISVVTLNILPLLVYPGYGQLPRRDKSGVSPYQEVSSCRWIILLLASKSYHATANKFAFGTSSTVLKQVASVPIPIYCESDWQQLDEQGLMFTNDDATREEDMRRLQRYRETGYGIPHEQVAAWLDSVGTDRELPCPE